MKSTTLVASISLFAAVVPGIIYGGDDKPVREHAFAHRKSGDGSTEFLYISKDVALRISHTPRDERKLLYTLVIAHFERFPDLAVFTGDIVDKELAYSVTNLKIVEVPGRGSWVLGKAENPSVDIELRNPQWFAFACSTDGRFEKAHWYFKKESLVKLNKTLGVEKWDEIPTVEETLNSLRASNQK